MLPLLLLLLLLLLLAAVAVDTLAEVPAVVAVVGGLFFFALETGDESQRSPKNRKYAIKSWRVQCPELLANMSAITRRKLLWLILRLRLSLALFSMARRKRGALTRPVFPASSSAKTAVSVRTLAASRRRRADTKDRARRPRAARWMATAPSNRRRSKSPRLTQEATSPRETASRFGGVAVVRERRRGSTYRRRFMLNSAVVIARPTTSPATADVVMGAKSRTGQHLEGMVRKN